MKWGEWWSILILRDAVAFDVTRFEDFHQRLGIAPSTLTRRLNVLVQSGFLNPPGVIVNGRQGDEYVPTDRGRDFAGVLEALRAFGEKHFTLTPAACDP